jgi:hypothetical protein
MATEAEVLDVLDMLAEAYPHFNLTTGTVKVYVRLLDDMDPRALKLGAVQCAREGTFFPSVSELVKATMDILLDEGSIPTGAEAWGRVGKRLAWPQTMLRNGHRLTQKPEEPLIERTVEAVGGWSYLRRSENPVSDRARFIDTYNEFVKRELRKLREHPTVTALRIGGGERRKELGSGS